MNVITRIAEDVAKKTKPSTDFAENKKLLKEMKLPISSWMLNKIAAALVRIAKRKKFTS